MPATVLIVDDNEAILRSTTQFLEKHGFNVVATPSPVGVTALIAQHKPELLVLDLMMPTLSGDALLKMLRRTATGKGIPTVLYSSAEEESLYRLSKSVDGVSYVQKSDGLELLLEAVRARIGEKPH